MSIKKSVHKKPALFVPPIVLKLTVSITAWRISPLTFPLIGVNPVKSVSIFARILQKTMPLK
jgi:hypothetical protein